MGDNNLKERDAFALMEDLQRENIPSMIDSKSGKLNKEGRQQLKERVEDFEKNKSNRIEGIQTAIEQVRYVINPVNQLMDLWRYKYEDNLLLNLSLHPLQDSIKDIPFEFMTLIT